MAIDNLARGLSLKGIEKAQDALSKTDEQYELIEKITVGYSIIESKPENWLEDETVVDQDLNAEGFTPISGTFYRHSSYNKNDFIRQGIYYYNGTDYVAFYENMGTLHNPVYTPLSGKTTFVANKYYSYTPNTFFAFERTLKNDGTPYNFKQLLLYFSNKKNGNVSKKNAYLEIKIDDNTWDHIEYIPNFFDSTFTNTQKIEIKRKNGAWGGLYEKRNEGAPSSSVIGLNVFTPYSNPNFTSVKGIRIIKEALSSGSDVYIYAIRA